MIVLSLNEARELMQRFEFRHPRFSVDLPVQFSIANEMLAGRCTEISTNGMRLELRHDVEPGCCGTVFLHYQNRTIKLNARVAYTASAQSGLEFLCDSTVERDAVAHLVASLTAPRPRRLMALVPKFDASRGCPSTQH
jgi:PilZ domain